LWYISIRFPGKHAAVEVGNPKKFWQYANSKRKTKSGIGELKTTNSNGEVDTAKPTSTAACLPGNLMEIYHN
jgi:hypothetical protein